MTDDSCRLDRTWDSVKLQPSWPPLAAVPDEVVDALVVHGSFAACREQFARYVANGVDIPVLAVLPFGVDLAEAVEGLAPR